MSRKSLFKEFLNHFWLRPENALLLALRADALRSTFDHFGDGADTVDISCGDGVFSFITMGGTLSRDTDMFRSLNLGRTFRKGDYDYFDKIDDNYFIDVEKEPACSYEIGTDWKDNLLAKAEKLDFYNTLFQHDNNIRLPLETGRMRFVYSNSAYWVERFEFHLKDLVRITEPGGHVVLQMKTRAIEDHISTVYAPFMGARFHEIVDAGRSSTWKGLRSLGEILNILGNLQGCAIKEVTPVYGGLPIRLWDVGLRPLFAPLAKLANSVEPEDRREAKTQWCRILFEMFQEFVVEYEAAEERAVEQMIVLEKDD